LILHSSNEHQLVFGMKSGEQRLLERTFELYPVMPAGIAPLSKSSDPEEMQDEQDLLDELMRESKAENRLELMNFLRRPRQFEKEEDALLLTVKKSEVNWLLEIVNEIRVGLWYKLGQPDPEEDEVPSETAHLEDWISMEYCADLQARLLFTLTDPK
tara:strand:- start:7067 stop:7537 length:471 start_codon:yes stop_codon:yes gene_type:complete